MNKQFVEKIRKKYKFNSTQWRVKFIFSTNFFYELFVHITYFNSEYVYVSERNDVWAEYKETL